MSQLDKQPHLEEEKVPDGGEVHRENAARQQRARVGRRARDPIEDASEEEAETYGVNDNQTTSIALLSEFLDPESAARLDRILILLFNIN